ncbi:hypothetical protein BU14_0053s0023 [Porphyra umbilicalis]|uniref:Uncharacterized protein n=1 Tax=Porphyra umbilicalis TaxID=2786 RepID=A0A1X6PHK6_PORUM|nr:hypothetical protein BU14_0053s0023 [Porphyra umbilicalis]|eukprot:OSX80359.1 hypothetical protein BU14_0053s0023 [Porphyra umbilicalis]
MLGTASPHSTHTRTKNYNGTSRAMARPGAAGGGGGHDAVAAAAEQPRTGRPRRCRPPPRRKAAARPHRRAPTPPCPAEHPSRGSPTPATTAKPPPSLPPPSPSPPAPPPAHTVNGRVAWSARRSRHLQQHHNEAVEVKKKAQQEKPKLHLTIPPLPPERPEDAGVVEQMPPTPHRRNVPAEERHVEGNGHPLGTQQEQGGHGRVDANRKADEPVDAGAQLDGVDVVHEQVGKEDERVDGDEELARDGEEYRHPKGNVEGDAHGGGGW